MDADPKVERMSTRRYDDGLRDVRQRNVLGDALTPCGDSPRTGFYRDGLCRVGPEGGQHTVAAVMTDEFLRHQLSLGNDLMTPRLDLAFPGLQPGDRWCVVAARWMQSYLAGHAAPVLLAATHENALNVIPLGCLVEHAADVPDDAGTLLD